MLKAFGIAAVIVYAAFLSAATLVDPTDRRIYEEPIFCINIGGTDYCFDWPGL